MLHPPTSLLSNASIFLNVTLAPLLPTWAPLCFSFALLAIYIPLTHVSRLKERHDSLLLALQCSTNKGNSLLFQQAK